MKRAVVSWDYIPVLTIRIVEENWDGDREPRDITEMEIELLHEIEALVRAQQKALSDRFGYVPPHRPFRMIYHGG